MVGLKRESREDWKNQKRIDALGNHMQKMGRKFDEMQKYGEEDNPFDIDYLMATDHGLS
jgi:hypothetical protein